MKNDVERRPIKLVEKTSGYRPSYTIRARRHDMRWVSRTVHKKSIALAVIDYLQSFENTRGVDSGDILAALDTPTLEAFTNRELKEEGFETSYWRRKSPSKYRAHVNYLIEQGGLELQVNKLSLIPERDLSGNEFVYFLSMDRYYVVKIGTTDYLKHRLKTFRSTYPGKLFLLGLFRAECCDAREAEKQFHSLFRAERRVGEWFYPAAGLLSLIDIINEMNRGEYDRQGLRKVAEDCGVPLVPKTYFSWWYRAS